jgi:hypothetical protein
MTSAQWIQMKSFITIKYSVLYKEYDINRNFLKNKQEIEDIDETSHEDLENDKENEKNYIVQVIHTESRCLSGVQRKVCHVFQTRPGKIAEIAMLALVFDLTELTYMSTIHNGNLDPKNYVGAKKRWNQCWEAMCTEI